MRTTEWGYSSKSKQQYNETYMVVDIETIGACN